MSIVGRVGAAVRGVRVANGMRRLIQADDEAARERSRQELCRLFAGFGGVPAKLGQLLGMRGHGAEFEELGNGVDPLPFDRIAPTVEARLDAPIDELFEEFSHDGIGASFGQVHRARTRTGDLVAVKIRYPGIESALDDELALLRLVPRIGVIRTANLDLDDLRETLAMALRSELDYGREARDQSDYARTCHVPGLIVPAIYPELSGDGVLTQAWEDGVALREVAESWNRPDRARVAEILVRHFLRRFFVDGRIHADPHTGNYRFRKGGERGPVVVLLDYGSLAEVDRDQRLAILRLLEATRTDERIDPVECFARAGFDAARLEPIAHLLPALARILFEPFASDRPMSVRDWRPGDRIHDMLGESAWWFRSAAPAGFLLALRAWAGLLHQLDTLNVATYWRRHLVIECRDALADAAGLSFAEVPPAAVSCADCARTLKVQVLERGTEKVSVAMPARVLDTIRDFMEPDVLARLEARGVDIDAIVRGIQQRGYPRGVVLEENLDDRRIFVELT